MPGSDAAALMDRIYRPQRRIYDLTRRHFLLGRDRLIARLAPAPGARVLELGCGTARNLVVAARLYPAARFFGLDVSRAMLETARASIARAGLAHRVFVARGDATGFAPAALFGARAFERVMLSYTLSMIPDWRTALDAALDATAPGGSLLVVDFGDQEGLPHWSRAALRRFLAAFHVTPRDALEAELVERAASRGAALELERPFRGYAQLARLTLPPCGALTRRDVSSISSRPLR